MIIAITGVPGTGKCSVAKELRKILNYKVFSIKNLKVKVGYDKKRKCDIVDMKKVISLLKKKNKKLGKLIFASHLAHFLPANLVDICIILRCKPSVLKRRLKKKRYSKVKIMENLEAEALDVILQEAVKKKHKIHEVNTTDISVRKTTLEIISVLVGKRKRTHGKINWSKFLIQKNYK